MKRPIEERYDKCSLRQTQTDNGHAVAMRRYLDEETGQHYWSFLNVSTIQDQQDATTFQQCIADSSIEKSRAVTISREVERLEHPNCSPYPRPDVTNE